MEPKCIAILVMSMAGLILIGIVTYFLAPQTHVSKEEDTTVVIGDLVEQHGMTKQHIILSLLVKGAIMVAITMFFFGVKTLWDRKNARMSLESFQNMDNHLREIKIATAK